MAEVIQDTSSTAEETAAASEELAAQANMLKGLVEKFQLKRNNYNFFSPLFQMGKPYLLAVWAGW